MKKLLIVCVLILAGCQSSGVVRLSPDTYFISRTSAAGAFANFSKLKAEVIQEANAFAESQGKVAIPVSLEERRPAVAGMPSIDYQFRVVDKNDPEAKRTSLVPRSDSIIEKVSLPTK